MLVCTDYDHADVENMNLDDYNIHVIASVFKQWLRDLPNPLLTFELYEEFIRAMGEWSASFIHLMFPDLSFTSRHTVTLKLQYMCLF